MVTGETQDPRDQGLERLRAENARLRGQIAQLEGRVAQLERKLAEALRKLEEAQRAQKRQAAPFSKGPPKLHPKPRGRKPGEDYGIQAHRPPPEKVDEVLRMPLPSRCPCGGLLEFDQTVSQFQVEIPRKPISRRFDIEVGHCRDCGRHLQGRHPLQTSDALGAASSQLGSDAQARTALLKDKEILGRDWSGDMTHDGGSPYDIFKDAHHQKCLGHIECRCKGILQVATGGAVRFPRAVRDLTQEAFRLRDRREAGELSPHGLSVALGRLEARLERLLRWNLRYLPDVKLANHLARHFGELFLFLRRPNLEGTSRPADQAIRPAVVNRKVFGGNRDPRGARAQEILSWIVGTCFQRGVEVFQYLSRILRAPKEYRDRLACRLLRLPAPS